MISTCFTIQLFLKKGSIQLILFFLKKGYKQKQINNKFYNYIAYV